ncbi:TRAP transporter permease [Chloroflexota bacterium]
MAENQETVAGKLAVEYGAPGRVASGFPKWLAVTLVTLALLLTVLDKWHVFAIDNIIFVYFTLAFFVPIVVLNHPLRKKSPQDRVPWYDWLISGVTFICFVYFGLHSREILWQGWPSYAPTIPYIMSWIVLIVMLSLAHRIYGTLFFIVTLFFSVYPLFAGNLPGVLEGVSLPLRNTVSQLALGEEGINGVAMRAAAKFMISFAPFIIALLYMGGGKFFINLALSIIGTFRGGAAKVAVLASALMASVTGGSAMNVLTTGVITIPAMKKSGYEPHYAAAIEACASTGGAITPPIMGGAAYIMASFLRIAYWQVVIAALIPVLLYYVALFVQTDLYAKRNNLKGLSREELPSFWQTLKSGWIFPVAILFFVYLLVFQRIETKAGFYAAGLLYFLYLVTGDKNRLKWFIPRDLANIFLSIAKVTGAIIVLFGIVGLVIGGVSLTGVALSLTSNLISLSGGNLFFMLLIGAVAAYILGMGMVAPAVYCIVAILLAPGLVQAGINPVAAHFFVLYWGMMSSITPPVAIGSMVASQLAGADFFKTGGLACRIGIGLFLVPFFFVMSPGLVLQPSPVMKTILDVSTCVLGLVIISFAMEKAVYLMKGTIGIPMRLFLFASGFLLAVPGWQTDLYGIALGAASFVALIVLRKARQSKEPALG